MLPILKKIARPDKARNSLELSPVALAMGRRSIASSGTGGTLETQQMLDFCSEKGIGADYELVTPEQIGTAFERMDKGEVRYRFVLDLRNGAVE